MALKKSLQYEAIVIERESLDPTPPSPSVDTDNFDACVPRGFIAQLPALHTNLTRLEQPNKIREVSAGYLRHLELLADALTESKHPFSDVFNIVYANLLAAVGQTSIMPYEWHRLDQRHTSTIKTKNGTVVVYPLGPSVSTPYRKDQTSLQSVLPTPLTVSDISKLQQPRTMIGDSTKVMGLVQIDPMIGFQHEQPLLPYAIIDSFASQLTSPWHSRQDTLLAVSSSMEDPSSPLVGAMASTWALAASLVDANSRG